MLVRMWRKGNPCTLLVGMQITASTTENNMEALKKLKIELTYDPATQFLGYLAKENENTILKTYIYVNVHGSIIYHSS